MTWWQSILRIVGLAARADAVDAAAAERRNAAARTAGEIAAEAERAAADLRARVECEPCPICDGSGRRRGGICRVCHGNGKLAPTWRRE